MNNETGSYELVDWTINIPIYIAISRDQNSTFADNLSGKNFNLYHVG